MIQIIVKLNNKTKLIDINIDDKIEILYKKLCIDKYFNNDIFIIYKTRNIVNIKKTTFRDINIDKNDIIFINYKLKGGIIDNILSLLKGMLTMMEELGILIVEVINILLTLFEIIPNIFQPSKLIEDVLYGVTHGITSMFSAIIERIDIGGGDVDKEKDGGPFGVTEKKQATCIPPTLMNLMILVLCPPLALFFK